MDTKLTNNSKEELQTLCVRIRELARAGALPECERIITTAMTQYPHAPQPHNLLGLLLEQQNDHLSAMKHFRAAWALDSTYLPARQNLDYFGTFFSCGKCAYDESDCPKETDEKYSVKYDENGVGHLVRSV